ncbi:MAG: VOC family protein [Bryobacterales bacterium]|nr:VOC family protein [Bryobacterales bacterium]
MSTNQEAFPAELLEVPGFEFVDHVAISVPRGHLDAQVSAYKMLGFRELHREEVYGTDQVRESLLQVGDSQNLIQLLEPLTEDSPVQKAIDKAGGRGGLAHVAFRVKSAQTAFSYLKEKGFKIIDAAPRPGSRGTTVFFLHPKSREDTPFGVLFECVEDPGSGAAVAH